MLDKRILIGSVLGLVLGVAILAALGAGVMRGGVHGARFHAQLTDADASDEGVVKTATTGKQMFINNLTVSCDAALDVTIEDEDDTVYEQFYFAAKGGIQKEYHLATPLVIPAGKALQVQTDTSGNVSVSVDGYLGS